MFGRNMQMLRPARSLCANANGAQLTETHVSQRQMS
jgi:hypothetical protein